MGICYGDHKVSKYQKFNILGGRASQRNPEVEPNDMEPRVCPSSALVTKAESSMAQRHTLSSEPNQNSRGQKPKSYVWGEDSGFTLTVIIKDVDDGIYRTEEPGILIHQFVVDGESFIHLHKDILCDGDVVAKCVSLDTTNWKRDDLMHCVKVSITYTCVCDIAT